MILIVYDAKKDRAWWLYVQQSLRKQLQKSRLRVPATMTAYISRNNVLDPAAIRQFALFRDDALAED